MDNQDENNKNNSQANHDHESSQKTAHLLGKGAASYFGGPVGNKIYNKASNTALGKAIERRAGKILEQNPSTRRGMNMLNDTKMADAADKAIDVAGGDKESAMKDIGESLLDSNNSNNEYNDMPIDEEEAQNLTEEELQALQEEQERINKEEEKKKKKADASKKLIDILKQNPKLSAGIIAVSVVVFIILIIFIYLYVEDYDLVGSGETAYDRAEYVSGYCENIYLIKEDPDYTGTTVSNIDDVNFDEMYDSNNDGKVDKKRWLDPQEYKLDDYVKGVIQAEASDVGDSKTYEVASLVARTYALQIASSKCYIWDNTNNNTAYRNPQNFTTDQANSEIATAVSTTAGIAIFDKDSQLLNMSDNSYYDNFCYVQKVGNDVEEKYNYYKMLQENKEERLLIYGDWVKENVPGGNDNIDNYNNSGKYDGQCQPNGLSLFGSKYLLNKETNPYSIIRTLKYYYNYDIELKKVTNSIPFGSMCGGFNLFGTTLTREQFINLVNSHNGGSKYSRLAAIAGEIYDMSVANNFNPELVIARAMVEGYSGGDNNYWGLAASNGTNGKNYPSLTAGVMQFIKVMNGYGSDNLYDVYNTHHYAYIGAKWFSPGGSGLGGCYYLPYISKYYTNPARLAEAQSSCASGSEIATNDEDQAAYSMWQVERMNASRKNVFGIDAENCDEDSIANGMNTDAILNSNASIGMKAAQLAVALFDNFGYSQALRMSNSYVDCSSLVYRTYKQLGINFGGASTSSSELAWCKKNNRMISESQLQPGDLLFKPGHVEIYIGNGKRFGAHDANRPHADQVSVGTYKSGSFTEFCRPY